MAYLESMPWWLFMLSFIGALVCACIVVYLIQELCEYAKYMKRSIKYKHKMKHRFDKPPLAKCYCHDCTNWCERDDDSTIGKCIGFADKYTAYYCFCKYADPRKTDPDIEES